jgi:two-component system, cell cycle sensor histidine kinase and response regulator CckA
MALLPTESEQDGQGLPTTMQKDDGDLWRAAIESVTDGVWDWDVQQGEVFFSALWKAMLGYSQGEIEGRLDEWSSRVHPDDIGWVTEAIRKHFRGETPIYVAEHRIRCKNGTYKWILDRGKVISWTDDGKPLRMVGTHTDITKQKESEENLRLSEEKFSKAFHSSTVLMALTTFEEGRILDANEAFATTLGFSREEVVGITVAELNIYVDPGQRQAIRDEVLEKGKVRGLEVRVRRKDGKERVQLLSTDLLQIQGKPYLLTTAIDVTEKKRLEEDLLRSRNLESLGFLAGGIAHDFNNLLTAITGYTFLAKSYIPPEDEVYKILTEAEGISVSGQELTRQLLTFSKGGEPCKTSTSINDVVRAASRAFSEGSEIKVEFFMDENLLAVEADQSQIQQAIRNILTNAVEAMPQGGTITISTNNITAPHADEPALLPGDYVRISVEDEGGGIPSDKIDKIFDPYFTTKEMGIHKGTGLGLTIAHSIVLRHRGIITVESTEGPGSTVHVYLPAAIRKVAGGDEAKVAPGGRKRRILFMDDEEMLRNMTAKLLTRMGYEPVLARDGDEAAALYRQAMESKEPFDAAILDLVIQGGMDGIETLKALLRIDPDVKAILLSGYADNSAISEFSKYRFKGALKKPYKVAELKELLDRILP